MSFSPGLVSNNILRRAFAEGVSISPMKLQKLLYFVASEYGKKAGEPLLNERFQAWRYGPVVRSVYDEFRGYGGGPIRGYAKDAEGKARVINEDVYPQLKTSIDRVWLQARSASAVELSRVTHNEGSAWSKTTSESNTYMRDTDVAADKSYLRALNLG